MHSKDDGSWYVWASERGGGEGHRQFQRFLSLAMERMGLTLAVQLILARLAICLLLSCVPGQRADARVQCARGR